MPQFTQRILHPGRNLRVYRSYDDTVLFHGTKTVCPKGIEEQSICLNEELRDPKICYQYVKTAIKDDEKYYLLLDEIQFMPRFEEVLNSLLRISNIDIYVTGSNSRFLSSDIVTEFRGRGDEIRVYPLSFAEFYSACNGEYEDAWNDYIIYGGLPQVAGFQTERQNLGEMKKVLSSCE